ncbi:phosphorylated adapter RNA export protein isoform X2 [Aedes albopictus]|uniref:Phosphorylated adapter RNA export protein n=1 Tax=Aedes albopictus TaxID=7160 RepID=A0ABM1XU02_AEDAL|nr:phosphorylated adapter RNA export protein-like isoform X2 [Aedes albopictus]XP_019564444.1 phosphorylated adapter RNA export protein-like isoform X2 [Aedes albopictus]
MTSMEHEAIKFAAPTTSQDLDLEEGEVTDDSEDGGYIPLQRPEVAKTEFAGGASVSQPRTVPLDNLSDQDLNDESEASSDDDSDEDGASFGKRMRGNNDKKLRIKPPLEKIPQPQTSHSALPNKYNIWTESLQEDTLMETMRGCDVTLNGMRNRDVESYDYNLKYRLNGGNAFQRVLKRRQSNSDDSDGYGGGKRFRSMSFGGSGTRGERKNVKLRLGKRNSSDSNSNDSFQNPPRHILDLNVSADCPNETFAAELANKLCEEKDELMLRVVNVLGKEIPTKLFKETQKIEADGGMLIMNGARRRTPGGVFLFLLKHNEEIDKDDKKAIFLEERKTAVKERKNSQAVNREKKVEELKKTLNRQVAENELPTRSDLLLSHLKPETHSTLSNPPPSPVGDDHREGSPDFEPQNVHVNVTSPEKALVDPKDLIEVEPESSAPRPLQPPGPPQLQSYDDDYLEMTCDDMDLF